MENNIFKKASYTRCDDSGFCTAEGNIIEETAFQININGKPYTTAMILGALEKEFVVGNLFTQGIINSVDDITNITIDNHIAKVTLSGAIMHTKIKKITSGIKVRREDIFRYVQAVLKSEIFEETEAVHSAGLFTEDGNPVYITEDIGRHNALDKIIGKALLNSIDLSRTVAASTGRMASDMISKVCRAGIPVIATKSAVTAAGLETGEKYGLTIIGFVRYAGTKNNTDMGTKTYKNSVMRIYCGAERVTG